MKTGIHEMAMAEYLALQAFSGSLAHTILVQSPLHAWLRSGYNPNREPDDTKASDIGPIAHACLLEGGTEHLCVIDPRDHPSKTTGEIPKGWTNKSIRVARDCARAEGKTPMLVDDYATVETMVGAAMEYIERSELAGIFREGISEPTVIWDERGLMCKARPDFLTNDRRVNLHYKTSQRSAQPDAFIRSLLFGMGYDLTAVHYARGIEALGFPSESVFFVQEQFPPYACSLVALTPPAAALATQKLERAMEIWRKCLRAGHFPAYPEQICWAELMPWQEKQLHEHEMRGDRLTDNELTGGIPA